MALDQQKWPSRTSPQTPNQGQPAVTSMPSERPAANPKFGNATPAVPLRSQDKAAIAAAANTKKGR